MTISVIIPAYKARKYLSECLESIARQTLPPKEILVIDDASPEPVDDIVEDFARRAGYPSIHLFKHGMNRGQAAARNTGIRNAEGEFLAFLDSDDLWAANHLENVAGSMLKENADLVFSPASLFRASPDEPFKHEERPMTPDELAIRPLALLRRCFIITSSTIVRSAKTKEIGGFDESESMRGVEDLDFFMKLLRSNAMFRMAPETTLYYRKHPESATGTVGLLSRQNICVKKRHIGWPAGSRNEKKAIMIDTYWNAVQSLWRSGAPDRWNWLLMAWIISAPRPLLGMRRFCRFLRAIGRQMRQKT